MSHSMTPYQVLRRDIRTLARRRQYLDELIVEGRGSKNSLDHMKAECAALGRVLPKMEKELSGLREETADEVRRGP